MGVMYLHARMFCTLTHMSSIPMGEINFYMHVNNILACKYITPMGIKVVSVSVKNVLACRNLLHP